MLINSSLIKMGTVFAEIINHNSKANEYVHLSWGDHNCVTDSVNYRYGCY
jgi:hypothetical protein